MILFAAFFLKITFSKNISGIPFGSRSGPFCEAAVFQGY